MNGRFARWRVRVELAGWRNGWSWFLAAALAGGAAAAYVLLLQPARQANAAAHTALQAQQRLASQGNPNAASGLDEQQKLDALVTLLRQSPETAQLVREMSSLARAEQIHLSQADYQHQQMAIGVSRVQITQPVRAGYLQLRRYIEAVLAAVPNASLDQVVARRDNVGQPQVEARLKWSLWVYRKDPLP